MIGMQRMMALAVLAPALWACGSDAPEAAVEEASAPVAAEQPTTAVDAPALTDPQIAHIAVTANTIDVETARLADTRAESREVKDFAQTMITDHTAVNEQAAALAQRLGVTPEANQVSASLQSGADAAVDRLEDLSGAEFDRAYIDREVEYHQAVLTALDDTLIPSASNAELRSLLEQVRPAIAAHLDHARALQSSLGSGS